MIVVALLLALAAAPTDDPETAVARERFTAGRLQYDLGRFDAALALFEQAYEAKPLPGFLFNIGQCHFQLEHDEQAIFFYERYLEAQPDAGNRDVVEELIADARARSARRLELAQAAPVVVPEPEPAPIPEPIPEPVRPAGVDDDGPPWLWIGIGGAAAVVAAAAGVGTLVWISSTATPDTSLGTLDRSQP